MEAANRRVGSGLGCVAVDHAGHEWLAQVGPQDFGDGVLRLRLEPWPRTVGASPDPTVSPSRWRRRATDRPRSGGTPSQPAADRPTVGTHRRQSTRPPRGGCFGKRECPEGPREPRSAEQHDALGNRGLRADDGVGGGDRPLQPAAREWVGQDRPAQLVGECTHAGSVRHAATKTPPAMIIPRPPRGSTAGAAGPVPVPSRCQADHLRTVAGREGGHHPGQRLAELQIEMHRTRAVDPVHRLFEGPDREWPPGLLLTLGCDTPGAKRPTGRPAPLNRPFFLPCWTAGRRCDVTPEDGPLCTR